MELLDSNSEIPREVRSQIKDNWSSRKTEVARKIALIEMGLLKRITEEDIAQELNIPFTQLATWKRNNRNSIEAFKEDIRGSKYNLMQAINERMTIASAFTQATLSNDDELADKCRKVLSTLDKILPINQLQTIGSILEKIDGVSPDDPVNTKIQINVNSPIAEAQKKLDEIKKAKQVDV